MAKKFGKRRKSEPRDLFGAPPPPRPSGPPASSTPLADYLAHGWPGVDEGYVVLPRSLAEAMPLPWQQQFLYLLSQFHQVHRGLSWPVYRVVPSRFEKLVDLDEDQLAEAGYLVEIDADGDMVYRERGGRKVEDPQHTTVLVSCLDPIPPRGAAGGTPPSQGLPERPRAVPVKLPPAPVWRSTPTTPSPSVPPLPEPPRKLKPRREPVAADPLPRAEPAPRPEPAPPADPISANSEPVAQAEPVATAEPGQTAAEPAGRAQPAAPAPAPTGMPPAAGQSAGPADQQPMASGRPAPAVPSPGSDADTPPRGIPLSERGWFDELPAEASADKPAEFGPTGEPTEIPYRYRSS